jgi:3-methyl-2-oxobutanoate hydroxymethyltransferase
MGHIGLTPQSVHQLGGHKVQGKTPETAELLLKDARALEQAGTFAVVLETVPAQLARLITEKISIPTIGIGAGPYCDGQVQVINDLLGMFSDFVPRHAKQYAKLADTIKSAIGDYVGEVKSGKFPTAAHSSSIDESLLEELSRS